MVSPLRVCSIAVHVGLHQQVSQNRCVNHGQVRCSYPAPKLPPHSWHAFQSGLPVFFSSRGCSRQRELQTIARRNYKQLFWKYKKLSPPFHEKHEIQEIKWLKNMKYMKYKKLYCLLFQSIRYETTKTMSRPHKRAYTCKAYNNACRVCSRIVVKPCADSIATSHRLLRTSCRLYAQSFPRQTCTVLHTLKLYNRPNMYRPVQI